MTTDAPPALDPQALARLHALVDRLLADADLLTHYHLLGVTADASAETIKQAYYARAQQLHPDRFLAAPDLAFRNQLALLFKRLSDAYQVLSSAPDRARYDAGVRTRAAARGPDARVGTGRTPAPSGGPSRVPAVGAEASTGADYLADSRAREYYDYAMRAFQRADFRNAQSLLEQALSREPGSPTLLRALDEVKRTRALWGE
jgi:curved DNA-binding protein CbpA